jgi:hypothetical protein
LAQTVKRMGRDLTDQETQSIYEAAARTFAFLRDGLAYRGIWTWAESGPRAPTVLDEHIRFGFSPGTWRPGRGGFITLFVTTAVRDGPDVMDDICAEIIRLFTVGTTFDASPWKIVIRSAKESMGRAITGGRHHAVISLGFTIAADDRN